MLYWFEKEHILCNKHRDEYSVINGAWNFTVRNGNSVLSTGKIIHHNISEPVEMTEEEFYKLYPDFGC